MAAKSFNVGTVRMILEKLDKSELEEMKSWIKRNTSGIHPLYGIGSGGNINKIFKMSAKKRNKAFKLRPFKKYLRHALLLYF